MKLKETKHMLPEYLDSCTPPEYMHMCMYICICNCIFKHTSPQHSASQRSKSNRSKRSWYKFLLLKLVLLWFYVFNLPNDAPSSCLLKIDSSFWQLLGYILISPFLTDFMLLSSVCTLLDSPRCSQFPWFTLCLSNTKFNMIYLQRLLLIYRRYLQR